MGGLGFMLLAATVTATETKKPPSAPETKKLEAPKPEIGYFSTPLPIHEIAEFYDMKHCVIPKDRPYMWTMTIESIDGRMSFAEAGYPDGGPLAKVLGPDPGEGGPKDWKLLNAGWAQADAVLGSGQMLRDEPHTVWTPGHEDLIKWRTELGKPKHPLQVIVTRTGDIPVNHPMLNGKELKAIVYTSIEGKKLIEQRIKESKLSPNVEIHASDSADLGSLLHFLLQHLRQHYDVKHLDVTAGSIVLGQLYSLNLVDEMRLTICGQLIGPVTTTGIQRPSIFNVPASQTGRLPPTVPSTPHSPQVEFTKVYASNRHIYLRGNVLKISSYTK